MKRWQLFGPLLAMTALALPLTAAAQTLVKFLGGPVGKPLFVAAGIE